MNADERTAAVTECLDELAIASSLQEIQDVVRRTPRRLVEATGGTFVLREGDQVFYADEDAASPLWKGQRFPIGECISGWAMTNGLVAVVPDISVDPRIPQEAYKPTFVRSLVMMPIGRPAVAAMGAYWDEVTKPSPEIVDLLRPVATAAAEAIGRVGLDGAPVAPVLSRPAASPPDVEVGVTT